MDGREGAAIPGESYPEQQGRKDLGPTSLTGPEPMDQFLLLGAHS